MRTGALPGGQRRGAPSSAGAAWAGSALPALDPWDGKPQESSGGRQGAGLLVSLLIYVVQKGQLCLHLCSATLPLYKEPSQVSS